MRNDRIKLNRHGVSIDGENQIILCSSLFYFRVPSSDWEKRILKLKAAGYNCVDVYFPWNFHETEEGVWDFAGEKDVTKYLALLKKHGMYVVARPGPYICSEWDGGAIPAWVLTNPTVRIRQADAGWLAKVREWYSRILPLIAPYQLDQGGTVILMQLENELDFFDCQNPRDYMAALRDMAREMGVTVPLFGCAGQCNAEGATGWAEDIETAFNFYGDPADPEVTEKFSYYYERMASIGKPLLITETNCDHFYLRRELAAGAKLLGPYNQAGGTNYGFTGSIGNWGTNDRPESFNPTHYSGNTLMGAAGEKNGQYGEGILFSSLIRTFGRSLAMAESCFAEDLSVECDFLAPKQFPLLCLDGGGYLLCIPNLSQTDGTARVRFDGADFTVKVAAHTAPFLPLQIPLASFGGEGLLCYANAELNGAAKEGETLRLTFTTTDEGASALVCTADGEIRLTAVAGDAAGLSAAFLAPADFTGFTERERSTAPALKFSDVYAAADLRASLPWRTAAVAPMEQQGVYRGLGGYRLEANEGAGLLLLGCGDIQLSYRNGVFLDTELQCGTTRYYPEDGSYEILSYIWAHCNFDDGRLPGLRLTSGKGIRQAAAIKSRRTFPNNWSFTYGEEGIPERLTTPSKVAETRMPLNVWNSTRLPLYAIYRRILSLDTTCDSRIIALEGTDTAVWVYVNGVLAGKVNPFDPYVDISAQTAGQPAVELAFYTIRSSGKEQMGLPVLYEGSWIAECEFAAVKDSEFDGFFRAADAQKGGFPLPIRAGEMVALSIPVETPIEKSFYFHATGKNLLTSLSVNGRLLGRLLLDWEKAPTIAGESRRFYCPASYCTDASEIRVQVFALGEDAVLEQLELEPMDV